MKALVSGGGIAGLSTGIALRQAGFDVELYERSTELSEIGAGLMIWPNGARALRALGVEVKALTVEHISLADWRGRTLIDYPIDAISERFGSSVAFVHRADLQSALAARFGRACLHLAAEVVDFTDGAGRVTIALRDGTLVEGDLLVGADGLRSPVRRRLIGDGDPVYLGSTIWRGIAPGDGINLPRGAGVDWGGRGAEFIAFHLPNQLIYWAGVTKEPRGEKPGPGGHKDDLEHRFGNWVQPVPDLIAATNESAILRNDMYDRPPTGHWSRGRVTLVGDAAHPMTPNMGQGACQALEDAVALADSLTREASATAALASYERGRLRKANRVVSLSRQATRGVQIENPLLCTLRDGLARLLPRWLLLSMLDPILAQPAGL